MRASISAVRVSLAGMLPAEESVSVSLSVHLSGLSADSSAGRSDRWVLSPLGMKLLND